MKSLFTLEPHDVLAVETKNRIIKTQIPVPEAVEIIKEMRKYEPESMSGQPAVIWDKALGYHVYDRWGNKWIDFSSGVVVANAGHCNPAVQKAAMDIISHGMMHSYCFSTEIRGELEKRISELVPVPDNRVFLLTTGSESTECAIKLARTYGVTKFGSHKLKIITFHDGFHGRTMGSQMAGGTPRSKQWIVNQDKDIQQAPFPNAFKYEWADETRADYSDERCFDKFLESLNEQGIHAGDIAGIMTETFQGGWVQFMPKGFMQRLRNFCTEHSILLIFDEIQAGFGRTGKLFGFMHGGITPDIVCCGKGISSGLPLSCVVGPSNIMNLYAPNQMTSTHTGNPVCSAAALASINYIVDQGLVENASALGEVCKKRLDAFKRKYPEAIGFVSGYGLAWALVFTKPGTKEMHPELARAIVQKSIEKGLMLFAPVGSGSTIKICPPLMINEEALLEGISVLDEAIAEALAEVSA